MSDWLGDRLRAGDPARHEPPLGEAEQDLMRRRILRESARPRSLTWTISPAWAVAGAAALLACLLFLLPPVPRSAGTPPLPAAAANLAAASDEQRRIEFVAPGGTRIFWTLDSRFQAIDKE